MVDFYNVLSSRLPQNRWADNFLSTYNFWRILKRLPKKKAGFFNDALHHIKTSDEILNPLRAYVSDKAFVKEYVRAKVGQKYTVPTIAILKKAEAQNFTYPTRAVIKPTHMSGEIIFRFEGETIDHAKIQKWFHSNYYHTWREANYRYLEPKVLIEPLIFDEETLANYTPLPDYKIFCLYGEPKIIQVNSDRHQKLKENHYTPNWEELPIELDLPKGVSQNKPKNLSEILWIASTLSQEFSLIRIDLYSDGKQIFVGEMTNLHANATQKFRSLQDEKIFSQCILGPDGFNTQGWMNRRQGSTKSSS